jgi:hypothetical protein
MLSIESIDKTGRQTIYTSVMVFLVNLFYGINIESESASIVFLFWVLMGTQIFLYLIIFKLVQLDRELIMRDNR